MVPETPKKRYQQLALVLHPDKGSSAVDFARLHALYGDYLTAELKATRATNEANLHAQAESSRHQREKDVMTENFRGQLQAANIAWSQWCNSRTAQEVALEKKRTWSVIEEGRRHNISLRQELHTCRSELEEARVKRARREQEEMQDDPLACFFDASERDRWKSEKAAHQKMVNEWRTGYFLSLFIFSLVFCLLIPHGIQ